MFALLIAIATIRLEAIVIRLADTKVMNLAEKWIPKCLKIRKNCVELAPIVDTNAVMSLTRTFAASVHFSQ